MSAERLYIMGNQNTPVWSGTTSMKRCLYCGVETTIICKYDACLNCHREKLCHD